MHIEIGHGRRFRGEMIMIESGRNVDARRAWSTIASIETFGKREALAAEISAVSDEHLRERLRSALSNFFRSLEDDLQRAGRVPR